MKKQYFLLSLLSISFYLVSDEIDPEFLKTLPDSVQKDVLSKIEAKETIESPVYRKASTFIDKDLEEKIYEVYGQEFFDTIQSSFMPINEPNLDSSYILDVGDVLDVQLVGQKNYIESLPINRDGSINLPEIGKIYLAGLELKDASDLIKLKISNAYIGTDSYVTLSNIRDINILIVGNAYNPGIYTLNGNSNILHALAMAGGINNIGSYRKISHIRNGETIGNIDLYDVLINGNYSMKSQLRSGDSVLVHPRSKMVSIESGVMRPMKYELLPSESINDLISFASGYNDKADKDNVFLKQVINGTNKLTKIDSSNIDDSSVILNGDSLFIREFKVNFITIEGAIKNPGTYGVSNGSTISQLIGVAGGYDDNAYPFGAYLENQKAKEINIEANKRLYNTFIDNILSSGNTASIDGESLGRILEQLKESEVTGRVIAEFNIEVLNNNNELDTVLEDGDRIYVPYLTQQVYVHGEVSNSGAVKYSPNQDISYYLKKSGGSLPNADLDNIFIIHPNGETENLKSESKLSFVLADEEKPLVYPGSIIYVPQSTDLASSLQVAAIWAPIISSIALSLTSLSVINNN